MMNGFEKRFALEIAKTVTGYEPMTADESAKPADIAACNLPKDIRKNDDSIDWPHVRWQGDWHPVPTMGEVEDMVLDSVCPTVDWEDEVEPDDPSSWLSVLGLI
jgi:hypothetical protein